MVDTYKPHMYNRLQHVQFQEKKKTSCTKLPALDNTKYSTANNRKNIKTVLNVSW